MPGLANDRIALFRREALEHQSARGAPAALLQIDAESTAWGFYLLCAGMLVALVFVAFGRMNEYATGPAFVRLDEHLTLSSSFSALVSKIEVAPGAVVEEGAVLVRFSDATETAELDSVSHEYNDQLAKLLQLPNDPVARDALVALRARRELAKTKLEQRTLRAPRRGVVGDVLVREGQLVEAGASIVALQEPESTATVVALLPGRYRPLLHEGAVLRFELEGFHRHAYELPIDTVGDQIIGPAEAGRYVGHDSADAFSFSGPVVLVQAKIHGTRFDADGQHFSFANGMYGKAETVVRNEPVAYGFVPSLKPIAERFRPRAWLAEYFSWIVHPLQNASRVGRSR
ncbi:MAG: efflux RND transporter periplasmic adaptor subunit [Polyangiaceae bacterium]